jgi:hypothetical protein
MRIRTLINPQAQGIWSTHCEGSKVLVTSRLNGKEKATEKRFEDAQAAITWTQKEEWSRLKKGFVLNDTQAKPGQPRMHFYRGRTYTGALPIFDVDGNVFCSTYDDEESRDRIFLLNEHAEAASLPELPKNRLIWKGYYQAELKKILLLADHQILSMTMADEKFTEITKPNQKPVSCLQVCGTRVVWYEEPNLVVTNLTNNEPLLRLPIAYQIYSGHSPQMTAALSPDGNTLACCVTAGEILLIEVSTGKISDKLTANFEMISEMAFTADGLSLIASEAYGKWQLLCFDLKTMSARDDWLDVNNREVTEFSICKKSSRIAIASRSNIQIYSYENLKPELTIPVEHYVKRFTLTWIGSYIGVQTDYGCASLYAT